MAEAMETLSDPEKMAEAREMMDDPDFRAMVMEALQRGGGKKVEALKAMLGDAGMAGSLSRLARRSAPVSTCSRRAARRPTSSSGGHQPAIC